MSSRPFVCEGSLLVMTPDDASHHHKHWTNVHLLQFAANVGQAAHLRFQLHKISFFWTLISLGTFDFFSSSQTGLSRLLSTEVPVGCDMHLEQGFALCLSDRLCCTDVWHAGHHEIL